MFIPAPFPLFEFDDSAVPDPRSAKRWLPSWQGPANEAAEDVCLGWIGDDGRQAVVSTALSSRYSVDDGRFNAVFLVLGGTQVSMRGRPTDPTATQAMHERIVHDDDAWTMGEVVVDGRSVATETTRVSDAIVGYLFVGTRLACYGAVGIDLPALRLRTLTEAAAATYPANPTTQLTNDELKNR